MFSVHVPPESLTPDNGQQSISVGFAEYMKNRAIKPCAIAKWPQLNGEEVGFQTLPMLKTTQIAQYWRKELNKYPEAYRRLPKPTAGVSPTELPFERKMPIKLPELSNMHLEQEVRDKGSEQ